MATFDKLSVINTCLIRTGNRPVLVEGDGSDEWITASDAWETNFPLLIEGYNWVFAEDTASLTRIGTSEDPEFTDAYQLPVGCLHVKQVYIDGIPMTWKVGINQILLSPRQSTPLPLAKFVVLPDPTLLSNTFVEGLRHKIMGDIYRGLNEDQDAADKHDKLSEFWMAKASSRGAQQSVARSNSRSRVLEARRVRKGSW